jgi:hypothetical protein
MNHKLDDYKDASENRFLYISAEDNQENSLQTAQDSSEEQSNLRWGRLVGGLMHVLDCLILELGIQSALPEF